jgi:uncharacterized oligopeptide transporter (OPT) family protein
MSILLGATYFVVGLIGVGALARSSPNDEAALLVFLPGWLAGAVVGSQLLHDAFLKRVENFSDSVRWLAVIVGAILWVIVSLVLAAIAGYIVQLARGTFFPSVEPTNGWLFWVLIVVCAGLSTVAARFVEDLL